MADILDYTQNTTPADADALYLVDDATGTPADNYTLLSDFYDSVRDGIDRTIIIMCIDVDTALTTGNGWSNIQVPIPNIVDGYNLIDAQGILAVASTSGNPSFQIYNLTQTADMLTTLIQFDTGDLLSRSASTGSVIDTNNDDVAVGDQLRFDCDIKGSAAVRGITFELEFGKP